MGPSLPSTNGKPFPRHTVIPSGTVLSSTLSRSTPIHVSNIVPTNLVRLLITQLLWRTHRSGSTIPSILWIDLTFTLYICYPSNRVYFIILNYIKSFRQLSPTRSTRFKSIQRRKIHHRIQKYGNAKDDGIVNTIH